LEEITRLEEDFDAILICKEFGDLPQQLSERGFRSFYIKTLVREISPLNDLLALIGLLKILIKVKPAILHTHSSKPGVLGRIAGLILRIPTIHTVHGFAFPMAASRIERLAYFLLEYICGRMCKKLIVMNKGDYDFAVQRLRLGPDAVEMIANGVDCSEVKHIDPEKRRVRELGTIDDTQTIVLTNVGRLSAQKNSLFLVDLAEMLRRRSLSSRWVILVVGDGGLRCEMENRINALQLDRYIKIIGWRKDVNELLACSDIYIHPSAWEGMPLAILEAMASRLPVVASNISGNRDVVSHGITGFLYDPGNIDQIVNFIIKLIESPDLRAKIGSAAFYSCNSRFSLETHARKVNAIYRAIIDVNSEKR